MSDFNKVSISYGETEGIVNEIIDCKNRMNIIFDNFKSDMNTIGSPNVLAGQTRESLASMFANLSTRFDDYLELVQQFANDIRSASERTKETDQSVNKDTEVLKTHE